MLAGLCLITLAIRVSRFYDPDKWKSPGFRKLEPQQKLVYFYMIAMCNNAGFLEFDPEDCAFRTGMKVGVVEDAFAGLASYYNKSGDWIHINEYLAEQRNLPLNTNNKAHLQIIKLITDMKDRFAEVYRDLVVASGADKIPEKKRYNKKSKGGDDLTAVEKGFMR